MLTAPSPSPSTAEMVAHGFGALMQQLTGDPTGHYRAFPQPDGHTIIARVYNDWQEIPDQAPILVMEEDGTTHKGNFYRQALLDNAEFKLLNPGEWPTTIIQEVVQSVWEPAVVLNGGFIKIAA